MKNKRTVIGIIAAVLAVVCIAVFTQHRDPAGSLPGQGSAAGGKEDIPVHLDPDSPLALLTEEEAEEAPATASDKAEDAGTDEKEKGTVQELKEETGKAPAAGQDDTKKEQEGTPADRQEEASGQQEEESGQKPAEDSAWTEYDDFMAKSPAEQDAFIKSFENMDAFTEWLVKAQKEWTEAHPVEEIGPGGTIDLGQ